ncbi:CidA/LrgA family protein [Nocardioides zeae]
MTPPNRPERPLRPASVVFLDGLLWLLGFWFVGELVVRTLDVPVPGAVVGMLGLFVGLRLRRPGPRSATLSAADGLLAHLQLLFIPAGVGIVAFLAVVRDDAVPIVGSLLASWAIGLVVVGWTVTLLLPQRGRDA